MLEDVKRVYILAHESQSDVLKKIQELSILHITDFSEEECHEDSSESGIELDPSPSPRMADQHEVEDLLAQISEMDDTIQLLNEMGPKKKGGMKAFVQDFFENKADIRKEDYESLVAKDYRSTLDICDEKRAELKMIGEDALRMREQMEKLKPFISLDLPLEELSVERERFEARIGSIEADVEISDLFEALSEEWNKKYIFTIYPKGESPEGFSEVTFNLRGTPAQATSDLATRIEDGEKRSAELTKDLAAMNNEIFTLQAVRDSLASTLARHGARKKLIHTERTYAIKGWVRARDQDTLMSLSGPIDITVEDSGPIGESGGPPISFKNSKLVEPFELVTRMYGPTGAIDPTPYLTPFFMLFFAICIGDAAYGIITIFFSVIFLKFLKMGKDGKDLFHLLIYSSIVMIPVGILTGSIFGDLFSPFWGGIIDPLEKGGMLTFLAFSLVLGLIQIYAGYGIKLYYHAKKSRRDALLDEGIWIIFITSGIVLLISMADVMMDIESMIGRPIGIPSTVGIGIFLAALILLVISRGRNEKGLNRLKGLGSTYDLMNVGTDVLSYSRLFALSITTFILAMTFNELIGMVAAAVPIPVLGYVVAAPLFIMCHCFIIFISSIGAFVHTARLQLLEFFTKFVEGEDIFFDPFTEDNKYVNVIR